MINYLVFCYTFDTEVVHCRHLVDGGLDNPIRDHCFPIWSLEFGVRKCYLFRSRFLPFCWMLHLYLRFPLSDSKYSLGIEPIEINQ